jgi:hypothetical protein
MTKQECQHEGNIMGTISALAQADKIMLKKKNEIDFYPLDFESRQYNSIYGHLLQIELKHLYPSECLIFAYDDLDKNLYDYRITKDEQRMLQYGVYYLYPINYYPDCMNMKQKYGETYYNGFKNFIYW